MIYRIRYCTDGGARSSEVSVEANSPNEAVVKFRHMQYDVDGPGDIGSAVTSVSADSTGFPLE